MRQKTSMALKMITGSILKKISRNLMVFSKARIKTVLPSVGGQITKRLQAIMQSLLDENSRNIQQDQEGFKFFKGVK